MPLNWATGEDNSIEKKSARSHMEQKPWRYQQFMLYVKIACNQAWTEQYTGFLIRLPSASLLVHAFSVISTLDCDKIMHMFHIKMYCNAFATNGLFSVFVVGLQAFRYYTVVCWKLYEYLFFGLFTGKKIALLTIIRANGYLSFKF